MTDEWDDELDPDFASRFATDEPLGETQLYLISPPVLPDDFAARLDQACTGGQVAAFQLRLKDVPDEEIVRLAAPLQSLCARHDVAFILNDNAALAGRIGADGVHLGQGDGDVRQARELLGPAVQIGVTCHDSRHLAMEAGEAGADYVAFGAFYPTRTKEAFHRPDPSILSWWSKLFTLPCVAIGGITVDNAAPLVRAGADFLAVSGGVWNHPDGPGEAVASFRRVIEDCRAA